MRFHHFFFLAPALLAAAQSSTNSDQSTASSSQSSSASDQSASSSSSSSQDSSSSSSSGGSSSASQSSSGGGDSQDNIVTRTFQGGRATLVTNAGGNIVGTVWGPGELASTLNNNDNLGTLMSSVPPTVYTTTGQPQQTGTSSEAGVRTRTVGGGRATLVTNGGGNIVGTVYGPQELASTLNNNDNLGTLMSSVPLTTFTTTQSIQQQTDDGSGNAAPAATAAPMLAGGLVGAGMMVVGLL